MELKELVEIMGAKKQIFKSIDTILPKDIGSRKKIEIFSGVNSDSFYILVIVVRQKSRFIMKHSNELIDISNKIISLKGHNYKKRFMIFDGDICSKSKEFLSQNGWRVIKG
jgi:hypothetical protein